MLYLYGYNLDLTDKGDISLVSTHIFVGTKIAFHFKYPKGEEYSIAIQNNNRRKQRNTKPMRS